MLSDRSTAAEATAAGLDGLKGHRSVGGIRASIYNAFAREGVVALVDFKGHVLAVQAGYHVEAAACILHSCYLSLVQMSIHMVTLDILYRDA